MTRRNIFRGAAALGAVALAFGLTACDPSVKGDYVTEGKLTIGTGEPAYFPWVVDDAPESGEGFEAAIAYAVANELGFEAKDVVWVRTTFDEAIAPGSKNFDFNLQQYSITEDRAADVDFSSPYYKTTQAIVTIEGSAAAEADSIQALKGLLIGAATGTTSLTAIEDQIAPTAGAQVFNSNDDAKLALESDAIDAIVVDLPTALYLTGVELTEGIIVGQLALENESGSQFGLVLAKDSPLTAKVIAAVDTLRNDGTLAALEAEWLSSAVDVPVLK